MSLPSSRMKNVSKERNQQKGGGREREIKKETSFAV
jgi:hypothetical protein